MIDRQKKNTMQYQLSQGYFWRCQDHQPPMLEYFPVPNVYCPPIYHPFVQRKQYWIHPHHLQYMGRIIGKNGSFFKQITQETGCLYIFFRQDMNCIELWGYSQNTDWAWHRIHHHIQSILSKCI